MAIAKIGSVLLIILPSTVRFSGERPRPHESTTVRLIRLIFASEVGTPMDPDNFSHSFVYGHLLEGEKRAAAESMSRALFGG